MKFFLDSDDDFQRSTCPNAGQYRRARDESGVLTLPPVCAGKTLEPDQGDNQTSRGDFISGRPGRRDGTGEARPG